MQTLRKTWVPLDVRELFELTSKRGSRLIQSPDELLELLVECLREIQQEITGETSAIRDLWDRTSPPEGWRPIDENDFSDYVVRSLRRRLEAHGVIALREVEIRRGRAGIPGERTDIHVTGVVQSGDGTFESVRVIIESKGCWHSELLTAMETQLVDRYLHENECQHGLYLVGWFNCDQWDADDHRRSRAPAWSVDHAREHFEGQAHALSNVDRSIRSVVLRCGLS